MLREEDEGEFPENALRDDFVIASKNKIKICGEQEILSQPQFYFIVRLALLLHLLDVKNKRKKTSQDVCVNQYRKRGHGHTHALIQMFQKETKLLMALPRLKCL
jgi:hypothetical protein